MNDIIIQVDEISKVFKISSRGKGLFGRIANVFIPRYIKKKAVDGISFKIKRGEAVGFIGPNGAGKSTTIKMLSGILHPTSGSITVDEFIPYKQRKKYVANIGVVFGQKTQLSWDLPLIDSFDLLRHIYSIPKQLYEKNLDDFIKLLDMSSFINQPVRQLSLGQRMKADIAAALLHSPKIVFFDEPTIGLDVVAKEKIRQFIRFINKEKGVTIIFTTHDMKDIEQTCERLIIVDKGKKIYDGDFESIRGFASIEKKLVVEFEKETEVENIKNVVIKDDKNRKKIFIFKPEEITVKNLISEIIKKYDVKDLTIVETDIDAIVCKIYDGGVNINESLFSDDKNSI